MIDLFTKVSNVNLVKIGTISKIFALNGEFLFVPIFLPSSVLEHFLRIENIRFFIFSDNSFPRLVQISKCHLRNNKIYIGLKDFNSIDSIKGFIGSYLLAETKEYFTFLNKEKSPFALLDFNVLNKKNEDLGVIVNVLNNAGQILLEISKNNQDSFFIPFVENFILDINYANKILTFRNLPDGLL